MELFKFVDLFVINNSESDFSHKTNTLSYDENVKTEKNELHVTSDTYFLTFTDFFTFEIKLINKNLLNSINFLFNIRQINIKKKKM